MSEGYYHKIVDQTLDDLLERLEVSRGLRAVEAVRNACCSGEICSMMPKAGWARLPSWLRCSCQMVARNAASCQGAILPCVPQYFLEELDIVDGDVEYSVSELKRRGLLGERPACGWCATQPFCYAAQAECRSRLLFWHTRRFSPAARCADIAAGRPGNVCHQQADA